MPASERLVIVEVGVAALREGAEPDTREMDAGGEGRNVRGMGGLIGDVARVVLGTK